MGKKDEFPQVVTASLTDDGAPAYLRANGTWSPVLVEAAVIENKQQLEELLHSAVVQERQVCDPYGMPVARVDGTVAPTTTRERIRAEGPTTRLRRPDPQTPATRPA